MMQRIISLSALMCAYDLALEKRKPISSLRIAHHAGPGG